MNTLAWLVVTISIVFAACVYKWKTAVTSGSYFAVGGDVYTCRAVELRDVGGSL